MKALDLHDVLKSFETASSRLQSQYMKAQNEVSYMDYSFPTWEYSKSVHVELK